MQTYLHLETKEHRDFLQESNYLRYCRASIQSLYAAVLRAGETRPQLKAVRDWRPSFLVMVLYAPGLSPAFCSVGQGFWTVSCS